MIRFSTFLSRSGFLAAAICLLATPSTAAPASPAAADVVITLDTNAFEPLKAPAKQDAASHIKVLAAAFPGFEIGTKSWQYGVNRFSLNPEGEPLVQREYVVKANGQVLFGTVSIHSRSRFWVAHSGVADPLGIRPGDAYGTFFQRHGQARCTRQRFSKPSPHLSGRDLLVCKSRKVYANYFFDLPKALVEAETMPDKAALADIKLVAFDIKWRNTVFDAPRAATPKPAPRGAVSADPGLVKARAEHAACVLKKTASDAPLGDLRIIDFQLDGTWDPGSKAVLRVKFAEVSGRPHMAYPGVRIEFSSNASRAVEPHILYGLGGCQTAEKTWEFEAPAYVAPGTMIRITAHAGQPLACRDGAKCVPHHSVYIERRLVHPKAVRQPAIE